VVERAPVNATPRKLDKKYTHEDMTNVMQRELQAEIDAAILRRMIKGQPN
jgi:hypothetical protein